MPNNFMILAYPRTGSYNLYALLDSCEDVSCYGELFKPMRIELPKFRKNKHPVKTVEERDADPVRFLHLLRRQTPKKHFGFKGFRPHLRRLPALEAAVTKPDWKKVILYRDPIEVYASTLRALQTSVWTNLPHKNTPQEVLNQPVRFTEENFKTFLDDYRDYLAFAGKFAGLGDTFTLTYDQVSSQKVMAALLEYLGSSAPASELKSDYRKQFTLTLEEGFENWDEFQSYLKGYDLNLSYPKTTITL